MGHFPKILKIYTSINKNNKNLLEIFFLYFTLIYFDVNFLEVNRQEFGEL